MAVVYNFRAQTGQNVKVELVRQAEVLLIDGENYDKRRHGSDYTAMARKVTESPAYLYIPRSGDWKLVIEDHDQDETRASLVAGSEA